MLAEGWLPIPEIRYAHRSPVQSEGMVPLAPTGRKLPPEIYRLEAFASTSPALDAHCVVFVKLDLAQGTNGFVSVEVDSPSQKFENGRLLDAQGRVIAVFDSSWKRERGRMVARIREGGAATLAVPTIPLTAETAPAVSPADYARERTACADTWRGIIGRAARVEVPEPLVNHAWRNAVVQNFQLINHGQLRYSTGNQYDQIYSAEGSDAVMALLSWGYAAEARRLMEPLFDFTRRNLELHQASFKLGNLIRYVWQTRDVAAIEQLRPRWEKEISRFLEGRTGPGGLFPKEQYCGDIHTPGDRPDVLVAMNPAALKVNLRDLVPGGGIIVNTDAFNDINLRKAGYAEDPLKNQSLQGYNVYEIPMSTMVAGACEGLGLTSKQIELTKNFFALGLVSWIYTRPLESSVAWIGKRFAKNPAVGDANVAALKAGLPERHNDLLLAEIDRLSDEVDAIVLAQLSMSALEPRLTATKVPVYNSGRTAFGRIRELLLKAG